MFVPLGFNELNQLVYISDISITIADTHDIWFYPN